MKPISSLKMKFTSHLPLETLYSNIYNWMQLNTIENDDLLKHHYFTIFSIKENEEIKFGIFYKPTSASHRDSNPAVIQFKQNIYSQVEIILDIPRLNHLHSLNISYPELNHGFSYEIIKAIFPVISQEHLKTIYPLEFLDHCLWKQQNGKRANYIFVTLFVLLPFLWHALLAKIFSILFLSAWLVNKYLFKTKQDPFYSQMKNELYPDSE